MKRTENAAAVVTGAGGGIGRAFALELARRGGRVVCADIDLDAARATAALIGADALPVRCDVAEERQVRELAATAGSWLDGPVDLVVNNAGIGAGGRTVGEIPLRDWRRTLDVNLWGVVHGCHVFVPDLIEQGHGGVINTCSAASFAAAPLMGPYNVSKAAVLALSETLAAELAGTGVAVTALCPTFVRTGIAGGPLIEARAAKLAATAMRWTGWSADRVARTALDAHDKGRLYVLPQPDARLVWRLKRHVPVTYVRTLGLLGRLGPATRLGGR
ncbi:MULTISPECIES: SDR family NAD(P)-dependent oxidoreductase [Actinomadura]|uniref:SDR family NAD(P)-dependent oxidoreductase n=1 Tax=Actinomadura yumaensis TaxID=111807 RepID=A0ABW2CDB6_9ACTN|nr:SDR family NAD(P)-dependent oxidoreductase [Actinomadura sp. J1-007]MWK38407.1 SDR family NAD(P)-dependent oxidoreductase [Actinomadura sp. J1-007]